MAVPTVKIIYLITIIVKVLVDVIVSRCYCQSMFWPVDVLGQKVDVFVVDVLKIDVIEILQLG